MKITLQVLGRERTFSEEELITILEHHCKRKEAEDEAKIAKVPTVGKWFQVNPLTIDQNLFKEERENKHQERTRLYILEAFEKMKKYPEKYAKPFKTMVPVITWAPKYPNDLLRLATKWGDHGADWVEHALEWAQRIANGESWEDLCNKRDTIEASRLSVNKDKYPYMVGGNGVYPTYEKYFAMMSEPPRGIVPLVVLYD